MICRKKKKKKKKDNNFSAAILKYCHFAQGLNQKNTQKLN